MRGEALCYPRHQEKRHTEAHFAKQAPKKNNPKEQASMWCWQHEAPVSPSPSSSFSSSPARLHPQPGLGNKTLTCNWGLMGKFPVWISFFYTLLRYYFKQIVIFCSLGNTVFRVTIIRLLLYENRKSAMNLMRLLSVSKLITL